MSDHAEDMKKYYSDEAWAELSRRREAMTDGMREIAMEGTRKWQALFADVTASLDEDPSSPKAQALLARWQALIDEFTGGNQAVKEGLGRAWSDRQNWSRGDEAERRAVLRSAHLGVHQCCRQAAR